MLQQALAVLISLFAELIALHLDNNAPGRLAAEVIQTILPSAYAVFNAATESGKDVSDCLKNALVMRQTIGKIIVYSNHDIKQKTLKTVIVYDNLIIRSWMCIMDWQVEYYKKENGKTPVLEYLLSLDAKMRAKAFHEIELLKKHGSELREPYVKPIKGAKYKGLFEVRVKFASDIIRIFYFTYCQKTFVLLHGFTKKSEKTPQGELERALRYKKDYERRCDDE